MTQEQLFELRLPPVNGDRVRQARELNGLTQAALSEALCIDQTMIAHMERGTKQPGNELLDSLATELHLPQDFFRQGPPPEFPKGSLLFRSKAGIGKKTVAQVHAHSELVFELVLRLSTNASLIPVRLPTETDPIEAARKIRKLLELPKGPFPNLVRAIERLGVITVPLPNVQDCDAFAVWAGPGRTHPVIGLVVAKATDRIRMSVAHELGHLVLHREFAGGTQELEAEAYRFAAELLMPAHDIAEDFASQKLNLFRLAALKSKWLVSMQALARKARELNVVSDRQYRYLMKLMSVRGWRLEEPTFNTPPPELPRVIPKLTEVAFGTDHNLRKMASEFRLGPDFIAGILRMCDQGKPAKPLKASSRPPHPLQFRRR